MADLDDGDTHLDDEYFAATCSHAHGSGEIVAGDGWRDCAGCTTPMCARRSPGWRGGRSAYTHWPQNFASVGTRRVDW